MTSFVERELTETESNAVRWLLEHGKGNTRQYLLHADRITVIDVCPCGCASIDFALDGTRPKPAGMEIISDHYWVDDNNHTGGVFLFAVSGQLAGLEVYSMDGKCDVSKLPDMNRLLPLGFLETGG